MKYIRAKDGIYDKVDETLVLASLPPQYELTKNGVHVGYEQCRKCILADTIEELCDEFVLYDADTKQYHVLDKGFYHRFDKESKKALHIANRYIYGAIWTDKGLIYVAKMNEEGEMELL